MKQYWPKSRQSTGAMPFLAPSAAQEFANITNLLKAGRKDEAWAAATAFYEKHPANGSINFLIALVLADKKQNAEALPYLERAVKSAPGNADYLLALGRHYLELGMIEYAGDVLRKAFTIDGTMYKAPFALANYYFMAGQGKRALPYYDTALKSAPAESRANIHLWRADCLSTLGRVAEAQADCRVAIDEPQYRARALVATAMLQKNDQTSVHAKKILEELEVPGLTDESRSALLLCLGRLHENGRDFDNAFLNFSKSRKLLNRSFDMNNFRLQVEDASRVLTRDVFKQFKSFGHPSAKPIFVVGMPRSGTTMTEQIIAAHTQVEGVGELVRMSRLAVKFSASGGMRQVLERMNEAGPEGWKEVPQQYMNLLDFLAPGACRAVDKMPHNFLYLGFIHLCFPNARIIHCKRHPLDNFISAFQNPLDAYHRYSYDQLAYSDYYAVYLKLMEHWKSVFPECIYESSYEALTRNPEMEMRKMLEFLGLPWEEGCLKFNETESTVRTFSRLEVRNPINTRSIGRWRNYERHLSPMIAAFKQAGIPV